MKYSRFLVATLIADALTLPALVLGHATWDDDKGTTHAEACLEAEQKLAG